MREWLVGGAIIEADGGLCLVRNRRRDGSHDWSPPGGVIEAGEGIVAGLTREVAEETGLVVTAWDGPIYEVRIEAPELGWNLTVEAHRALAWTGSLAVEDPDGIVVAVDFVTPGRCAEHLADVAPWVRDPVVEWLAGPWPGRRSFAYGVAGADRRSMVVSRR